MSGSYEPDYWQRKSDRVRYWLCIVKYRERTCFKSFPKDVLGILTKLIQNQPAVEFGDVCKVRANYWKFDETCWSSGWRMRSSCRICDRPNLYCLVRTEGGQIY